jgi:beta-glucosidase
VNWNALDNYEWGDWDQTFGLLAADRATFANTPKLSLACLGDLSADISARNRERPPDAPDVTAEVARGRPQSATTLRARLA